MCGRSTTHFSQMVDPSTDLSSNIPRTKNLGTVVGPQGDHGASLLAGVGSGISTGSTLCVRHSNRVRHLYCVPLSPCMHHTPPLSFLELSETLKGGLYYRFCKYSQIWSFLGWHCGKNMHLCKKVQHIWYVMGPNFQKKFMSTIRPLGVLRRCKLYVG